MPDGLVLRAKTLPAAIYPARSSPQPFLVSSANKKEQIAGDGAADDIAEHLSNLPPVTNAGAGDTINTPGRQYARCLLQGR